MIAVKSGVGVISIGLNGPGGGMADAADLKSADRKVVWVQFPPGAPFRKPSKGA